jgi:hypothetical protein
VRRGLLIAVLLSVAGATAAAAQPFPPPGSARLSGTFQLKGRVTQAMNILGEHRGDVVYRQWKFTPLCQAGQCQTVRLVRQRAGGSDTLLLHRTAPARYVGQGRFFAPLRCAGVVYPRGVSVPFTITVRVTAVTTVLDALVASQVHATYVNRRRQNLTACVAVPGHDAAVYDGALLTGQ